MCDSAEDSYSALMTSSLPRPNVGTHSGRVVMQGGGGRKGAVVVVVVEKKISGMLVPPWVPCDSTCPSCVSRPSLDPQHSLVRQIKPR